MCNSNRQEAEDLASKHGLRLYRVSVKDNLNVNERKILFQLSSDAPVFQYLVEQYVKNRKTEAPETTRERNVFLTLCNMF